MKKITIRLILTAVMAAAWGMPSPVHAAPATGFEVTNGGVFDNNGSTVTPTVPAETIDQPSIASSATGENSTTQGSTTISEAFTAPNTGAPYDVVTDIDFYINNTTSTPFSGITGWTVEISEINSLTSGAQTIFNADTLIAQPAGGGYTPLTGITSSSATAGNIVQITPGNLNYLQLTPGDIYVITIGTTATNTTTSYFNPQTTSTTATGMSAGTLSGSTFTPENGNFTFFVDTVPVPEPSNWWVVAVVGTLAFVAFRRFRGGVIA